MIYKIIFLVVINNLSQNTSIPSERSSLFTAKMTLIRDNSLFTKKL